MSDTLALVTGFRRDKVALLLKHRAGAVLISEYDYNNTYQYVVNREETQLTWLNHAVEELGATPEPAGADAPRQVNGRGKEAAQAIFGEDARDAAAFIAKWTPLVASMANARHAKMLHVILGETVEQQRFFEQALAGNTELLGHRSEQVGARVGSVMATRWVE